MLSYKHSDKVTYTDDQKQHRGGYHDIKLHFTQNMYMMQSVLINHTLAR